MTLKRRKKMNKLTKKTYKMIQVLMSLLKKNHQGIEYLKFGSKALISMLGLRTFANQRSKEKNLRITSARTRFYT